MRKLAILLIAVSATCGLHAQSSTPGILTISPRQCVWHAGDNPAWDAPSLDQSGWRPLTNWKLTSDQPRLWLRCHLDSATLSGLDNPALEVHLGTAWEGFLNGTPVARNGNIRSGNFSMDLIRIFPLPRPLILRGSNLIALRIGWRYRSLFGLPDVVQQPGIRLGDLQSLRNDRAAFVEQLLPEVLLNDVPFIVIGIVGVVLLGFSFYDRSRSAPFVLSTACIAVGLVFADLLSGTLLVNEPVWLYAGFMTIASAFSLGFQYIFPFALAGRRVPRIFWLPLGVLILEAALHLVEPLVPLQAAFRLDAIDQSVILSALIVTEILLGAASLVAFWPWNRIPPPMRLIAALTIAWGMSQSVFFLFLSTSELPIPGIPDIFRNWMFPASTIAQFFVIAAIIALNLRDQRQTALQRASLAGELQAAQEIQRALVPASIATLPCLAIAVAFLPAREVGGDYYHCGVLPGNRQRILIGDVSGKGAAAAMTAAVLLGAVQEHQSDPPAALLAHLNRVLTGIRLGGFATCLCAEISADGRLTLANAGHVAPYRNGEEVPLDSGLPLGITADTTYPESTLRLAPNDRLTFLSDGVVEATSPTAELFGFDRTRDISSRSAEEIAQVAQKFGQEDDITVLTLTFTPAAEIVHA